MKKKRLTKKIKLLSYSTQVMLGHTSVSSECMLCTLKPVSKYQPSRMHFPLDFNFTPTSSKPTYATGRMAEWLSAKLLVKCTGLKGFLMENHEKSGCNQLTKMAFIWLWWSDVRFAFSNFKIGYEPLQTVHLLACLGHPSMLRTCESKTKDRQHVMASYRHISSKSSLKNDTNAVWFPPKHVQHWL